MTITQKSILGKIAKIDTNINKIRDSVHEVGMDIMTFVAPEKAGGLGNGDTTTALALVQALPTSWQPLMVAWFKAFSPIKVLAGSGKHGLLETYKKLDPSEKPSHWDLKAAADMPFHKLNKEDAPKDTYDLDKLILASTTGKAASLRKMIADGKVPEADIETVKALANALSGLKIARVSIVVPDVLDEQANDVETKASAAA